MTILYIGSVESFRLNCPHTSGDRAMRQTLIASTLILAAALALCWLPRSAAPRPIPAAAASGRLQAAADGAGQALRRGPGDAAGELQRRRLRRLPQATRRRCRAQGPRRARQAGRRARLFLDAGQGPRRQAQTGIDNLAKAIDLDAKDGSGWATLAGYASDPTGAALPDHPNIVCAPAEPTIDPKAFEALIKATQTEPPEWGYPAERRT